ncbi:MAG: response regulator [Verrucomicrobia bacterium]|nr:response regulator [Verrucomicrobiota bacterium]
MSGRIRTLVVDDEKIICEIVRDILVSEGGRVETLAAQSCEEGLRLARQQAFDVVFLDVRMEDGCGVDLLKRIREHQPGARIYMITGYRADKEIQQALAEGAAGFISKPFRVKDILGALHGPAPASA